MKLIRKLFLLFFLLLLGAGIFLVGYYFAVTKGARLDPEKLVLNEKTVVFYDGQGEPVRNASTAFLRQTTPLEEIPLHTQNAFISTEDRRFYKHGGYDIRGILRAIRNNIKSFSFREGASTISQQLIKNTHLSQEKTLKRKLREWKLTRALEKRYSKREILEKYLNTIYFGHSCFGITSAAEFYFGKTPAELTLAESAILAGIVKSPNNYSPFKHPDRCQTRKAVVLKAMQENGAISNAERLDAERVPLPEYAASLRSARYLQFVFDELSDLAEAYDFTVGGKIEIFTYLDQDLQKSVEEIAAAYTDSDKSFLVLDGNQRGFKAGVSTLGNAPRLPASLLKPLLVYAPAVEENLLSPATPILDEKTDFGGYSPENFDGQYHGYQSMRECVEKSLNIPAVKTLQSLTVEKGAAYLEKLGLPVEKADKSLALALGGMQKGYPLKDLLAAYAALQQQGAYAPCGFIQSVRIHGKTVYRKPTAAKQVFSEETAYLLTDVLKTTAQRGTAKKLRSLPVEIAAKTGTAGTKKGNTDAYALAYTPTDCVAVWLGNADNSPVACTGGGAPCNLLYQIQEEILRLQGENTTAPKRFPSVQNAVWVELDSPSYQNERTLRLADELAPPAYRFQELFKKDAIPLDKSDSFTSPSILPPQISLVDGRVEIAFDERSPRYYRYKIERRDSASRVTLYEGEFLPVFVDSCLQEGKSYEYSVTPYFGEREGASVPLPVVSVGNKEEVSLPPLPEKWWE